MRQSRRLYTKTCFLFMLFFMLVGTSSVVLAQRHISSTVNQAPKALNFPCSDNLERGLVGLINSTITASLASSLEFPVTLDDATIGACSPDNECLLGVHDDFQKCWVKEDDTLYSYHGQIITNGRIKTYVHHYEYDPEHGNFMQTSSDN